jgi:hypothetical protein
VALQSVNRRNSRSPAPAVEPTIDTTAKLHDIKLGACCEVGARTILQEIVIDDYSDGVNESQIGRVTSANSAPLRR